MTTQSNTTTTTTKSRVGRKPVVIPAGVNVDIKDRVLAIKGPKGSRSMSIHPYINVTVDNGKITINMDKASKSYCRNGSGKKLLSSIPGTTRAEIQNAVQGVATGFERKLLLVGVGYRAQMKGKVLSLTLGYSHPIEFHVPEGITIETPSLTEIIVKGADKHHVGHTAAKIRAYRGPEPYKGKGIKYADEIIVRKETKKK